MKNFLDKATIAEKTKELIYKVLPKMTSTWTHGPTIKSHLNPFCRCSRKWNK